MIILKIANTFNLSSSLPNEEVFQPLVSATNIVIEPIISTSQATPPGEWYDQNPSEWVILLQGEASLAYGDGSKIKLSAGDYVFIPAHQHGDWAWSGNPTAPKTVRKHDYWKVSGELGNWGIGGRGK